MRHRTCLAIQAAKAWALSYRYKGGFPLLIPPISAAYPGEPLHAQVYRTLKEELLGGRIAPGGRLPSIRQLAQHLGISRNPVEAAYDQLAAEGYIASRPKSGYYAADLELLEDIVREAPPAPTDSSGTELTVQPPHASSEAPGLERPGQAASLSNAAGLMHRGTPAPDRIRFDMDGTDTASFPFPLWRKLTMEVLQPANLGLLGYGDRRGEPKLRELTAAYLRQTRGVRCTSEQLILTSGTQQSMLLIASLLRGTHREWAVEGAMDPRIAALLRQQGIGLHGLPLEEDGFPADRLDPAKHRAAYVTPSHQFPYGMVLPAAKRLKLLQWAEASGGYLIEDDYDSDFRFEGRPVPALQGMDSTGRVVYLGTFSRSLSPAFRLSYCILPPELLGRFHRELPWYESSASRLTQKTMELFMERGGFERHVRRMKQLYRHKRAVLLEAITRHMGGCSRVSGTASGLHVLLRLDTPLLEEDLRQRAAALGVDVRAVSSFQLEGVQAEHPCGNFSTEAESESAGFLLGFGSLTPGQIEEGVRRLALAWFG
ncbi:GntR family transcriptional regulator/MocR family aminotransferase [Paenibacillus mucilaginosus]|uniref:MocR-like pyridoxine biosynthesis transcription factor PdxR n=1 Tax=Paenibacillus mucilaginosus TaxID=61624 RepID=UPI003D24265D